jgi:hypothetical protein
MSRIYEQPSFVILDGEDTSNELEVELQDADKIFVHAPAGIEADISLQFWNGAEWIEHPDDGVFTASTMQQYDQMGLKYRLHKAASTVSADRTFRVLTRVG